MTILVPLLSGRWSGDVGGSVFGGSNTTVRSDIRAFDSQPSTVVLKVSPRPSCRIVPQYSLNCCSDQPFDLRHLSTVGHTTSTSSGLSGVFSHNLFCESISLSISPYSDGREEIGKITNIFFINSQTSLQSSIYHLKFVIQQSETAVKFFIIILGWKCNPMVMATKMIISLMSLL
ncbi:hypothetical protein QTP88_007173 [Uroleucon formosanum]